MSDDIRDEVLAWMQETGRGYRAAEKQFGIPRSTIQSWRQAAPAAREVKPNARTHARVRARDERQAAPAPVALPPWDPTTCTREEFLVRRIHECLAARELAVQEGHGGVARQWEISAGGYRDELDELREAERRKREARGQSDQIDPDQVAERLLRAIPRLARIAPERARELWVELGRSLGEVTS